MFRDNRSFWRIVFSVVVLMILAVGVLAQTKRPITHEDVWLMKRVGAPAPSPDGKWVVFSVIEPSYVEADQVSDLWLVPADGSAKPRRLTNTKGGESGATWSPDGKRIAFSARREGDEVAQVYVLSVEGGEAMRVTTLSTGARSPQFSPDGKAILFQSSVFPGALNDEDNKKAAAERKARKWNARVYESFPVRNWDRWLDDKQTHVFVQSLDAGTKAKDLLAGTKLVAGAGFAGVTGSGSDDLNAVWSPDGQSVVIAATNNRNASAYSESNTHLYAVPASGGEPKQLTTGQDSYGAPKFSPDGKTLFCQLSPNTEKVYNLNRIAGFAWPSIGERKIITAGFDRAPSSFALTPDGKTIYLLAEDSGHEKLYSVAAMGGQVSLVMEMTRGVYTNLVVPAKAQTLFANWEAATNPAEIVRIDLAAKTHKALSDFNAERIAQLDLPPLRHHWFTSKRGKKIHSQIVLPPNFDENKKYPLFVFIHGGPHTMTRDQFFLRWNYHFIASPGYVVLMTDYTGSTGYGEKFAQEIQRDPLKGPGEELNEAADAVIKDFKWIDGARQAAGGASYGGHLANWLQATTTRYKCLISHAGLINLESQWGTSDTIYGREVNNGGPVWEQGEIWRTQNPIRYAANFKTPMLITVGENDFRVPLNNSLENWSIHQRLRIPSKLLVFPEENHWILRGENNRFFFQEVHAWLNRWLNSSSGAGH
ncbi:MAG TPA: S9 family peptidase [Blastocatellia bacterium]|nr:S9 family peptidase [Blastocatellia bacterium]HMZ22169.1 S9 family peptidase [Blastocatellia bacterium]HNG29414.1 S9 family peptidase [Blastocatellia bacterium]